MRPRHLIISIIVSVALVSLARAAAPATKPAASSEPRTDTNSLGMKFIEIKPGEFLMGSPEDEKGRGSETQHKVKITKSYMLGLHPVTVGQFTSFAKASGYKTSAEKQGDKENWQKTGLPQGPANPVVCVSWNDATAFCQWLAKKEGKSYRLPTEAEWEYACRAGTTTPFYTGTTIRIDQANYDGTYVYGDGEKGEFRQRTTPVGLFKPNPWGLYDMHGNVWQWCSDWYVRELPADDVTDPTGPEEGSSRVQRGGAWRTVPAGCRSASRRSDGEGARCNYTGFRCAMDIP